MSTVRDANQLSSGTPIENAYADFANSLKSLANQARLEWLRTPNQNYNPSARKAYTEEVSSLNKKLQDAKKNSPLERQAQVKAGVYVKMVQDANPNMEKDEVKKLKQQALTAERAKNGAYKNKIQITPKEWEAIQAGAISHNKLTEILANTDTDVIRSYATPRTSGGLTPAMISQAKTMLALGTPQSEVAQKLGVSTSTLYKAISE